MRRFKIAIIAVIILLSVAFAAYIIYDSSINRNNQSRASVEAEDEERKVSNVPVALAGVIALLGFAFSRRRK
jgi:Na+/H+ antiporter NhaC